MDLSSVSVTIYSVEYAYNIYICMSISIYMYIYIYMSLQVHEYICMYAPEPEVPLIIRIDLLTRRGKNKVTLNKESVQRKIGRYGR